MLSRKKKTLEKKITFYTRYSLFHSLLKHDLLLKPHSKLTF